MLIISVNYLARCITLSTSLRPVRLNIRVSKRSKLKSRWRGWRNVVLCYFGLIENSLLSHPLFCIHLARQTKVPCFSILNEVLKRNFLIYYLVAARDTLKERVWAGLLKATSPWKMREKRGENCDGVERGAVNSERSS